MSALAAGVADVSSATCHSRRFTATRLPVSSIAGYLDRPGDLVNGTPFQGTCWLQARYASLARVSGVEPLMIAVRCAEAGTAAMVLPLLRLRRHGLTMLEFADLGLTDYNAPLLGPAAPRDRAGAVALWRAVRAALPGIDCVALKKMPASLDGRANPLTLLPGARPSRLSGQLLDIGSDYLAWRRATLDKPVRKELERAWRVFSRHPGAEFQRLREPEAVLRVYDDLTAMQRRRAAEGGFVYRLDEPSCDETYRRALETGLADGQVVLTALTAGGETVAALFGIADGASYVMLRIADAGGDWRTCTPGRLLIDRTMEHLHREGYRTFDFAIGEYAHKRRFKTRPVPLVDLTRALTLRGMLPLSRDRAEAFVMARPKLERLTRRLLTATRSVRRRHDIAVNAPG